jgi:hypothetical protein
MNNRLFLNKNSLYVNGISFLGGTNYFTGDVSMNSRLYVTNDISFGGNLEVKGNTNLQKLVAGTTNFQNLKVLNDLGVEGDSNINKDLNVNGTITCKDSITASVLNAQKKLYINKFKFEQNEVEPSYLKDPSNMTLNLKQHDDFGIDKPVISFYIWKINSGIGFNQNNKSDKSPARQLWNSSYILRIPSVEGAAQSVGDTIAAAFGFKR